MLEEQFSGPTRFLIRSFHSRNKYIQEKSHKHKPHNWQHIQGSRFAQTATSSRAPPGRTGTGCTSCGGLVFVFATHGRIEAVRGGSPPCAPRPASARGQRAGKVHERVGHQAGARVARNDNEQQRVDSAEQQPHDESARRSGRPGAGRGLPERDLAYLETQNTHWEGGRIP